METAKPHFSRRTQTFPINNSKGNNRPPAYPPPTPFRPEKKEEKERKNRIKIQHNNVSPSRLLNCVTKGHISRGASARVPTRGILDDFSHPVRARHFLPSLTSRETR